MVPRYQMVEQFLIFCQYHLVIELRNVLGGSPGLVVMLGDSCSRGCGFESQHRLQEGLSHLWL